MTRILVVDDDAALRRVVTEALLEDGYQVDAAGNGRQALAAFREHRPDALVLDLEMPIMDGPTLMRTLRERTKWGQVPLVVVSGTDGATDAAPRLGARACLNKPFELRGFVAHPRTGRSTQLATGRHEHAAEATLEPAD